MLFSAIGHQHTSVLHSPSSFWGIGEGDGCWVGEEATFFVLANSIRIDFPNLLMRFAHRDSCMKVSQLSIIYSSPSRSTYVATKLQLASMPPSDSTITCPTICPLFHFFPTVRRAFNFCCNIFVCFWCSLDDTPSGRSWKRSCYALLRLCCKLATYTQYSVCMALYNIRLDWIGIWVVSIGWEGARSGAWDGVNSLKWMSSQPSSPLLYPPLLRHLPLALPLSGSTLSPSPAHLINTNWCLK